MPWRINKPVPQMELDEIRRSRELVALRIVAAARLGVATVMIAASYVGQKPKWPQFNWVPWFYLAAGIVAAAVLFSGLHRRVAIS